MKRNLSTLLALLLAAAHAAHASQPRQTSARQQPSPQTHAPQPSPQATPSPQPTPGEEPDEDVVRITSNLVQFDAVVTDSRGRLVTDLHPEDFEVLVEGRRQEVTNFSFVLNEAAPPAERPSAAPDATAPPPPVPLKAGQVRRTIALVVDDLGTAFEDIPFVRRALKKFVDEQMRPGDLVAIMRTSAGVGALQRFTADKRLLYSAIEHVRWNPQGRAGIYAFAPVEHDPAQQFAGAGGDDGGGRDNSVGRSNTRGGVDSDDRPELEEFRQSVYTVGTLGALDFIVRGMRELPGRKSVLFFSNGFQIYRDPKDPNNMMDYERLREKLRRLCDLANRAAIVIYTMDTRGLPTLGVTAADSVEPTAAALTRVLDSRKDAYLHSQESLAFLARQTGGLFIHNTNDLGGGVRRVLEDQRGYYLIGFRPGEGLFDPSKGGARFNKFEVKVRRAGLSVRTRAGFYGYTENQLKAAAPRTRSEQLVEALASPLTSGELTLRLTSLFNSPAASTEMVSSLMHIDVSQFKFEDEAGGWKKAVIDLVAITFGENGQVVDEIKGTETVRARGEGLRRLMSDGLVYVMKVPVKRPGAYQLRVAVRDAATEKLGSASQYIEVPDLKKGRLALSGIFIRAAGAAGARADDAEAQEGASDQFRDATVRRFRSGSTVDFFYDIYNARVDRATGRTQLQTQTRLFRDGRPVFEGSARPYEPGAQAELARLQAASRLQLGTQLPPGDYVLQVVVSDLLAKEKGRVATQWIDFEIVE